MRALIFDGCQLRLDEHHADPRPGLDEALLQVRLAGICATDLEIVRGYAGFSGVLGHEFVGHVLACDARPDLAGGMNAERKGQMAQIVRTYAHAGEGAPPRHQPVAQVVIGARIEDRTARGAARASVFRDLVARRDAQLL